MTSPDTPLAPPVAFLSRPGGDAIAYHKTAGRSPTVLFLTGLRSDMTGGKALALEAMARARGLGFIRFDYRGHGASGGRFEDGTIGAWLADSLEIIDRATTGPLILVGSSLGGWLMLLAARARPARIKVLVGVAPAADFTETLITQRLSPAERERIERDGRLVVPSAYSPEPTIFTRALIEEGRHHLLLGGPIRFDGPVRLIHGLADPDVPWQTSLRIAERLTSSDVEITLVKDGGHRLSDPPDLARLCRMVAEMAERIA